MATKNIHFDSLVGAQRGVTGHKKTRANTTPQPPAPIPKRGDLPTADQIIHSLTDVAAKMLAPTEGKIVDSVPPDTMCWDVRRIVVEEP